MHLIDEKGVGKSIGTITAADSQDGVIFTPQLSELQPGIHGFHIHENANCSSAEQDGKRIAGLAAGGHYDPGKTGSHQGPYGEGHLGDLPVLYVGNDGKATLPVLAPRFDIVDVKGRSIIIHAGGDNYSDKPEKLGGGGSRIACGIIE